MMTNLFGFSYDIELSQKQLQEKIEKKFPYEKKKFLSTVVFSNPEIILKDGSEKVYIHIEIKVNITNKISFYAYGEINGKIFYDNNSKEFYLQEFEIDELVMDQVPLKFHNMIQTSIETVSKIVLNKYPVYKIKADDLKKTVAVLLLKNINVKNEKMIITLGI
jgi:hypothetical protein